MAWFTDTEKVNADFTAGVLDITVEPGKDAETPLSFDNLRPMEYEKFLAEINQAGNGNVSVDGYDPKPVYFQPVVVTNAGTLPVCLHRAFGGSSGYERCRMPGEWGEEDRDCQGCPGQRDDQAGL